MGCTATTGFVSSVRGVGFGFFPIWDDLQAPCTTNGARMSWNTSTAYNQGVTSAQNAQAAMNRFGFASYDDVWLDIEGYDSPNSSCRAAVLAYVDGWDAVLGPALDAGVYGSADNIDAYATLAHVSSAVDVAAWDTCLNSAWNLPDVPNSHWVYDQRIHQYRGRVVECLPFGS